MYAYICFSRSAFSQFCDTFYFVPFVFSIWLLIFASFQYWISVRILCRFAYYDVQQKKTKQKDGRQKNHERNFQNEKQCFSTSKRIHTCITYSLCEDQLKCKVCLRQRLYYGWESAYIFPHWRNWWFQFFFLSWIQLFTLIRVPNQIHHPKWMHCIIISMEIAELFRN